ncbi:MAG: septum formation protein Maf [Clostridia bacterium]|nr:septum formation protein Maf [Clostridia bacterium]
MRYILASKSPRRREILKNIGLDFTVITAETDETSSITEPAELVKELSLRKGRAVADMLANAGELCENDIIISADTVVECEGEILGKPRDKADALRMLKLLSGNCHRVLSGVTLIRGGRSFVSCSETSVYFDEIKEADALRYIDSGEPFDKAGGYGIQGYAGIWVRRIDGCYFGVVGLSVNTLDKLHRDCTGHSII